MAQYYYGRHWGTFDDPVAALIGARFSRDFAEAQVRAAGDADVFVAFDERFGVRLVCAGTTYTRWLVCFEPLFDSEEFALAEGERMPVLENAPALVSAFLWTEKPRSRFD